MGNLISNLFNRRVTKTNNSEDEKVIIDKLKNLEIENKFLKEHIHFLSTKKTINDVIDEKQIKLTADKLIKDKDVNLKYLPDFIERRFYESIIRIFLALIKETCDTTKLSILGHEIDIVLQKKTPEYFSKND